MQFTTYNQVASIGAFIFGASQLIFLYIVFKAMIVKGKAPARVWEGATGLEWTLPSPPPYHTFESPPDLAIVESETH